MLEIQSPAGCPEGVIAAVQNGADAVYLGLGKFGTGKSTKIFTADEFGQALEYCRIRGVKTYMMLSAFAYDHELPRAAKHAKIASSLGIDAIVVQDLGVMMAVRRSVPDVPVHAGTRMGIHNLEGVRIAAAMGIKRVALSRELSRRKLLHICRNSPIEIEVFAHGASCICYDGQCCLSAMYGRGSDNRGQCSQPCRLSYGTGKHAAEYPLSMKDVSLVRYLSDLDSIGVAAVKIGGLMKRPEYSAIVTGVFSKAAHSGKAPSADDMLALQKIFSRQGFTDGYYTDRQGRDMLGMRGEDEPADSVIFATARKNYLNGEYQRVPVRFVGRISEGKRAKLGAADDRGNSAVVYGPVPEQAFHRELTVASLRTQLYKTGGTPFRCVGVKGFVEPGLTLPIPAFDEMRRELLDEILQLRKPLHPREEGQFIPHDNLPNREEPPVVTVSVMRMDQLSKEMEELSPNIVYIPIMELDFESPVLHGFLENEDVNVVAMLPRVIHDNEKRSVSEALIRARASGVTETLVGNIGHIQFSRSLGFEVRGDFGLNVFNSETLWALFHLKLKSATLSFELRLAEIRSITKPIDTELITYGRLPLMYTENCIVRNSTNACTCDSFPGLTDRHGALFHVAPEFGCRNVLLNSKKLFMADKQRAIASLGLWAQRLMFTTENALECAAVMKRYIERSGYEPLGYTRGLYYTGVD